MQKQIEQRLIRTYKMIQQTAPNTKIDSLEVVKQVEEYRQFWRPNKTIVVLLAESHVYTNDDNHKVKLNKFILGSMLSNYPLRFVRFVYCLGYGENDLLNRRINRNPGTWQFWKIFSSCVSEDEDNLGFHKVLKTGTRSFVIRLHNKVEVLKKLRKEGVWLLDASVVGLYGSGKKDPRSIEKILEVCWKYHIKDIILEASPKHILVIGKGVGDILHYKLHRIDIPFSVIPQPQARGNSEWQLENYKTYQRICAANCE